MEQINLTNTVQLPNNLTMQDFIKALECFKPEGSTKVITEKTVNEVLTNLPENIPVEDLFEFVQLVTELNKRIDNFDESECLTTEELLEEISKW